MTKDISVAKLIKCAEIHFDVNAKCDGCDYIDWSDCVDAMLRDAIEVIKAGRREACKVENRPTDARKGAEPISVSTKNERSPIPVIEAYSVVWYEEGVTHCPQFTDIENAIKFADKVMHDKPKVDMVTIRRSEW